jgi:hypothetical protein
LESFFSSIEFIPNVADINVYIHKKVTISLLLHLFDDILLITNDAPHLFLKIKHVLSSKFDMTNMGLVNHNTIFGLKVIYDHAQGFIQIFQQIYVYPSSSNLKWSLVTLFPLLWNSILN